MTAPLVRASLRLLQVLAVLILCAAPRSPSAQQTLAEAMAHAIARMMESMGFNLSQPSPPPATVWPWPLTQPFSNTPAGSWYSWQGNTPWATSVLEGIWEDNQGGLLIVQGGFYRLYAACRGYIDGDIRVLGNRVELTNRRQGFSQTFEFALDQGRLALRDQNGQIYVYRRLILNPSLSAH